MTSLLRLSLIGLLGWVGSALAQAETAETELEPAPLCPFHFNVDTRRLHSDQVENLCTYYRTGNPILIVNTASHCGFTKQFNDLEALHKKYQDKGLIVLGFPSNSFNQEEKSEEGTARVCFQNFGVTFPMFEHVDVKGAKAHPLFVYLAARSQAPAWNFNKYLIADGEVHHFGSRVEPLGAELEEQIRSKTR